MAANNFRVHTDANYRLRGDVAGQMQSSRFFNKQLCITDPSTTRNIISDSYVQPYTKKYDDGACDYDRARESELKINSNHNYTRPMNYSNMMGNNSTPKLDQSYNINQQGGLAFNDQQYPHAFSPNKQPYGNGPMGGFQQHQATFEPFKNKKVNNMNTQLPPRPPPNTQSTNFGGFNPKAGGSPNNYKNYPKVTRDASTNNPSGVNLSRPSYAATSNSYRRVQKQPTGSGREPYTMRQQAPRDGFFFEPYIAMPNVHGGHELVPQYITDPEFGGELPVSDEINDMMDSSVQNLLDLKAHHAVQMEIAQNNMNDASASGDVSSASEYRRQVQKYNSNIQRIVKQIEGMQNLIAAGNTFDTSLDADYDFATATVTRDDSRTSLQQRQQNVADASMARLNENMPVQFGEKYPNATPQQYLAYRTYVQGLYNEQSGQFTSPPMGFMQHQTQSS